MNVSVLLSLVTLIAVCNINNNKIVVDGFTPATRIVSSSPSISYIYRIYSVGGSDISTNSNDDNEMLSIEDYENTMLNLNKPIEISTNLISDLSVVDDVSSPSRPTSILKYSGSNSSKSLQKKRWSDYDQFLEQELGDLDAELEPKDQWMQQLRDVVEQKVGYAIWSKKSEQEIQREIKKSLLSKGLHVPDIVAKVIRAVFLEKTHTMSQYKKEDEFACAEFRKWMMEQKKKTKKNPLQPAKIEVSKRWLGVHPAPRSYRLSSSSSISGNGSNAIVKNSIDKKYVYKHLSVIMDECTQPVYGVTFGSSKLKDGASPSSVMTSKSTVSPTIASSAAVTVPPTTKTAVDTPGNNSILAAVMRNWDRTQQEMIDSNELVVACDSSTSSSGTVPSKDKFFIDDVSMYVANAGSSNYYVVL